MDFGQILLDFGADGWTFLQDRWTFGDSKWILRLKPGITPDIGGLQADIRGYGWTSAVQVNIWRDYG